MSEFTGATAAQTAVPDKANGVNGVGTNAVSSGTATTTNYNKTTISQRLSKIRPSRYPLDTVLRNIGSEKTNSDKYEFYSVVARGNKVVVGGESATYEISMSSAVEITLASGIHSLSLDNLLVCYTKTVSNSAIAAVASGAGNFNPLVLHIVEINYSSNKIKVVGVNGASTHGTTTTYLATDDVLYRMGGAVDQDIALSYDPQVKPSKDYNWVQRNICTVSENVFQALQDKEIEYGMADFKEQALLDFRYQAEMDVLFGAATSTEFVDPVTSKRKLHMRGLCRFGIQNISRDTSNSETMQAFLNGAMEDIFSGNNGSEERLLIAGPGFAQKMANANFWEKQLASGETEIKWGVKWRLIESNFGTLRFLMSPIFGLLGPYTNYAVVIDPANIRYIHQVPMFEKKLDLVTSGIRNTNDVKLEEAVTLEVTNPLTHGILYAGA